LPLFPNLLEEAGAESWRTWPRPRTVPGGVQVFRRPCPREAAVGSTAPPLATGISRRRSGSAFLRVEQQLSLRRLLGRARRGPAGVARAGPLEGRGPRLRCLGWHHGPERSGAPVPRPGAQAGVLGA
jgi:hypothetical protein